MFVGLSVCLSTWKLSIRLSYYHEIFAGVRYGQELGWISRWLHCGAQMIIECLWSSSFDFSNYTFAWIWELYNWEAGVPLGVHCGSVVCFSLDYFLVFSPTVISFISFDVLLLLHSPHTLYVAPRLSVHLSFYPWPRNSGMKRLLQHYKKTV